MADFIRDTKDNQRLVGVVLEEGETSIEIPNDISIVAPRVFTRDITIKELSTVASCRFSEGSFYGNSTIRILNLSADTVVDSAMFAYGNTVEEIVLEDGSPYLYQGGVLLEGDKVVLGTAQEEIVIPEGVTRISPYAFSGCYGIHSVKFPSTLEEIGEYAFCDCNGIEELSIPRKVSSVGIGALSGMPTWAYQGSYSSPTEYVPAIRGLDIYHDWLVASHKSALGTESHIDIRKWDDGTSTELAGIAGGVFDGSSLTALQVVRIPAGQYEYAGQQDYLRICSKSFLNFSANILTVYFEGKVNFETNAFSDISTLRIHIGSNPCVFEDFTFKNVGTLEIYVTDWAVWEACQKDEEKMMTEGGTYSINLEG